MRLLLNAARQAFLSYKGLFLWLNWPAYIANAIVRPALTVTMFGLMGRFAQNEAAATRYVIGMTAFGMTNIVMGGLLQSFYYERSFGTLSQLFASSGSRLQSYLVRGILHMPNAALNAAVAIAWAALVIDIDFSDANWGPAIAGMLLISFSATLFGLFCGNFCIVARNWFFFMSGQQALFIALTGMVIPREDMPPGLRELSGILPVTHALEGARKAFAGMSWTEVRGDYGAELIVCLAYTAAGYLLFRVVELYARRSGAYEMA